MQNDSEAVTAELAAIFLDKVEADTKYDAIEGTYSGRILNADAARLLSPRYQTITERIAYTSATYGPAAEYVLDRFKRRIAQQVVMPDETQSVHFLAGGAASGKTAATSEMVMDATVIFDSNLASLVKAVEMIDYALEHGWLIKITYVHREFSVALDGMVFRACETGRYVPLALDDPSSLAQLHFRSQRTFLDLRRHYADNSKTVFAAVHNRWTPSQRLSAVTLPLNTLESGGKYHYHSVNELYAIQEAKISELQRQTLPDGLIQALAGK